MTESEIVIGGDMEDIPAGTYQATLTSIEVKQSASFGDFRAWTFQLDSGSVVGGNTSMSTHAKSKGGKWIAALLGKKPEKGDKVQLAGKRATVAVAENDKGWPQVTDVLPPAPPSAGDVTPAAAAHPAAAGVSDDLPF